MAGLLEGKCAVVTGSGRGMGREIALALAKQGVKVVVNDLGGAPDGTGADHAPADEVVAEIKKAGGVAVANYDSVADFNAAENIINACASNFGKIDILVNCAGIVGKGAPSFWEIKKENWDTVIAVNLNGTFNTCRHALGFMVKQNSGRIINFSSPAWLGAGATAYTASKGAITSLTIGLAQVMMLGGYNITCNAMVPIAATRIGPRGGPGSDRTYKEGLVNRQLYEEGQNPPGPEHVVGPVLYLCTDQAANFNGQIIGSSRGRVAVYTWPTEAKGIYKDGIWTLDELVKIIPRTLAMDLRKTRG
jgi:NAD(P)-dependent dehydrogenase (short-subunit alcohol dehydrogenase family)